MNRHTGIRYSKYGPRPIYRSRDSVKVWTKKNRLKKALTWRTSRVNTCPLFESYDFGSWMLNEQIDPRVQIMCMVSTPKVNLPFIVRMRSRNNHANRQFQGNISETINRIDPRFVDHSWDSQLHFVGDYGVPI